MAWRLGYIDMCGTQMALSKEGKSEIRRGRCGGASKFLKAVYNPYSPMYPLLSFRFIYHAPLF